MSRTLVIAVLAATSCLALERTLWIWRAGPFCRRIVVWDAADLTEPNLRSYYQRLSRELRRSRAWTVDVFIDRADAAHEVSGKMVTEKDYDWWLGLYNKYGRKLLPMAEFSGYGADGVLRLRDRYGTCSETVLSGENFLRASVDDVNFEVLQIYYRRLPPNTKPRPGDEAMISVYVRASAFPSVEQARGFSRLVQRRFREKQIIVEFRTDAFFIDDLFFPIMYRFDPAATPPSKEEYKHSKTMACICDEPGIPCR
jgi:hypothetical protein